MSEIRFPLPDVGEGLTEAEIVQWRVAPGDRIALDQVFVEIETAKSLVELPSAVRGRRVRAARRRGQRRSTSARRSWSSRRMAAVRMPRRRLPRPRLPRAGSARDGRARGRRDRRVARRRAVGGRRSRARRPRILGPCGHASEAASVARRRAREPRDRPGARRRSPGGTGAARAGRRPGRRAAAAAAPAAPRPDSGVPVIAKPPIRKLAKDLGVDLSRVAPTGPIGDITRDDVIRAASQVSVFRNIQTPEWPTDREDRIPVKGVRKAIANAMVQSAYSAPHVSVFVDVDATRTMEYVKRLKASPDYAGVRVSPLLIMAKAMIWAVRRNPSVNAQWTDEEIIVKHYVNLGVAAATPRGLIVPNVKEAQAMTMVELATALEQLTLTAREGKTQPAEMQDGTITITNIGVFGMDTGTPILNPGEVAIVALGTIKQKPWVVDGEVRPRFVTTVGASFDHRVVDGDVASRFLADVASIIEEPALLLE